VPLDLLYTGAAVGTAGQLLTHGDTISLGRSNVSTYIFVVAGDDWTG
jgi:hypothetical protein